MSALVPSGYVTRELGATRKTQGRAPPSVRHEASNVQSLDGRSMYEEKIRTLYVGRKRNDVTKLKKRRVEID